MIIFFKIYIIKLNIIYNTHEITYDILKKIIQKLRNLTFYKKITEMDNSLMFIFQTEVWQKKGKKRKKIEKGLGRRSYATIGIRILNFLEATYFSFSLSLFAAYNLHFYLWSSISNPRLLPRFLHFRNRLVLLYR